MWAVVETEAALEVQSYAVSTLSPPPGLAVATGSLRTWRLRSLDPEICSQSLVKGGPHTDTHSARHWGHCASAPHYRDGVLNPRPPHLHPRALLPTPPTPVLIGLRWACGRPGGITKEKGLMCRAGIGQTTRGTQPPPRVSPAPSLSPASSRQEMHLRHQVQVLPPGEAAPRAAGSGR